MTDFSVAARSQRPASTDVTEKSKRRWNILSYIWILPALLIVAVFTFYPVGYAVDLAVHRNLLTRPGQHPYIGLENFVDVLGSPALHRSVIATAEFTVMAVVGTAVFGILIGLLLNEKFGGAKFLQVAILIPWAIPPVMTGIIWRWMFAGNVGIINGTLYSLGLIDEYYSFFGNPTTAKLAVLVARLWKDVPLATILLLASLQVIPDELYDAAKIDGAGVWTRFRYVTFPYLKPTLTVILILETIISFVTFDLIFAMTGGGPANATTFIAWFTYSEIFRNMNLGTGAALAFVIALVTLVLAVFYLFALRTKE